MEEFAHVPEVILDLPDAENTQDHRPPKYIGMDLVRTELVREPARACVQVTAGLNSTLILYRKRSPVSDIRRPTALVPLLPHSYASQPRLVTDVIVKVC